MRKNSYVAFSVELSWIPLVNSLNAIAIEFWRLKKLYRMIIKRNNCNDRTTILSKMSSVATFLVNISTCTLLRCLIFWNMFESRMYWNQCDKRKVRYNSCIFMMLYKHFSVHIVSLFREHFLNYSTAEGCLFWGIFV